MNDQNESGVEQWDRSYALEESATLWGDPPVPYVVEVTERWLDPDRPSLEIPCGDGRNTLPLGRHVRELTAIDSSERALALARERVRAAGVQDVTFRKGNVFDLPLPSSQFGSVVCWDLLSHLENPVDALREIIRVCDSAGIIVANFFSLDDSTRGQDMAEIRPNEYIYDNRFYFHYYSQDEVELQVRQAEKINLLDLQLVRWTEPPHEGYREYEHEHESWAIILEVQR